MQTLTKVAKALTPVAIIALLVTAIPVLSVIILGLVSLTLIIVGFCVLIFSLFTMSTFATSIMSSASIVLSYAGSVTQVWLEHVAPYSTIISLCVALAALIILIIYKVNKTKQPPTEPPPRPVRTDPPFGANIKQRQVHQKAFKKELNAYYKSLPFSGTSFIVLNALILTLSIVGVILVFQPYIIHDILLALGI